MAQYCSISFSIVRSNSSIVYVSDGCCSATWFVALSAFLFPNETGSFAFVCVCVCTLAQRCESMCVSVCVCVCVHALALGCESVCVLALEM